MAITFTKYVNASATAAGVGTANWNQRGVQISIPAKVFKSVRQYSEWITNQMEFLSRLEEMAQNGEVPAEPLVPNPAEIITAAGQIETYGHAIGVGPIDAAELAVATLQQARHGQIIDPDGNVRDF